MYFVLFGCSKTSKNSANIVSLVWSAISVNLLVLSCIASSYLSIRPIALKWMPRSAGGVKQAKVSTAKPEIVQKKI